MRLGGLESLKVIILVSALRRELGVNLAAGDVLQCSSISDLEALVEAAAAAPRPTENVPREGQNSIGQYPIYAIPRFWKAPVGWLISLHEIPDETSMRIACRALVRRHVGLRVELGWREYATCKLALPLLRQFLTAPLVMKSLPAFVSTPSSYDHYVKLAPSAGRMLEAASTGTGIPTDHLLVAALAASLGSAAKLDEVKLTLIVPMRDGPGSGKPCFNPAPLRLDSKQVSLRYCVRALLSFPTPRLAYVPFT
eukprot:g13073.t1